MRLLEFIRERRRQGRKVALPPGRRMPIAETLRTGRKLAQRRNLAQRRAASK